MEKQLGWTTLEQSKKLIEVGLEPDTADMFYLYDYNNHKHNNIPDTLIICNWDDPYNKSIPCWSLGRLIELMPEIAMLVRDSTGNIPSYFISIGPSESGEDIFLSEQYSTSIEAAISTIIWLLENNYIKKGE